MEVREHRSAGSSFSVHLNSQRPLGMGAGSPTFTVIYMQYITCLYKVEPGDIFHCSQERFMGKPFSLWALSSSNAVVVEMENDLRSKTLENKLGDS